MAEVKQISNDQLSRSQVTKHVALGRKKDPPSECLDIASSYIYKPILFAVGLVISNNVSTQLVLLQTFNEIII